MAVLHDNTSRLQGLINEINNLPTDTSEEAREQGYNSGYTEGYTKGHTDGYEEGVENAPIPEGYIKPSGELSVTENGTHDVTQYASVNVNVAASGGGAELARSILDGTITEYHDEQMTKVGKYAFYKKSNLANVYLPNVTELEESGFQHCKALTSIEIPNLVTIQRHGFSGCDALTSIELPNVTAIYNSGFYSSGLTSIELPKISALDGSVFESCSELEYVDFGTSLENIYSKVFSNCTALKTVILRSNRVVPLSNTNAFSNTPIGTTALGISGFVYVPDNLVDSYKTATNWSTYANQIKPLSELEV